MKKLSTMENIVLKSANSEGLIPLLNAPAYAELANSLEANLVVVRTAEGYRLTLLGHELRSELSRGA